jgi:hypothetical protein
MEYQQDKVLQALNKVRVDLNLDSFMNLFNVNGKNN